MRYDQTETPTEHHHHKISGGRKLTHIHEAPAGEPKYWANSRVHAHSITRDKPNTPTSTHLGACYC